MIELQRVTLHLQPSLADPAHIIRWSSINPTVASSGTRYTRFLIWLLSRSIQKRLNKTIKNRHLDEDKIKEVVIHI